MIFEALDAGGVAEGVQLLQPTLIRRQSTAPPPKGGEK